MTEWKLEPVTPTMLAGVLLDALAEQLAEMRQTARSAAHAANQRERTQALGTALGIEHRLPVMVSILQTAILLLRDPDVFTPPMVFASERAGNEPETRAAGDIEVAAAAPCETAADVARDGRQNEVDMSEVQP